MIADAAYTVSDQMHILFTGSHCQDPIKDAINYFLIQMHIHIDMSFGLLTKKCQTFQSLMQTSLSPSSVIIMATPRVHNYVITVDLSKNANSHPTLVASGSLLNWGYSPTAER
jgi:hypothetical protein